MKHQEAFDILNQQLQDIPKAQIRMMSLSVLPRLMNVLDENQNTCPDCKKFTREGECFVKDIRPLFEQDIKHIRHFEQWTDETQKHLKQYHNQHVKGRITSTFSTIGMAIGSLIGFAYSYLADSELILGSISIGWAVGMIIGYIAGKLKEKQLSKKQLTY